MKLKSLVICLAIFLYIAMPVYAGTDWVRVSPITQNTLFGIKFLNSMTGIAVGDNGTIIKTIDGGSTWSTKNSGFPEGNFIDVWFITSQIVLVVGPSSGVMARSTNCGENWTLINSPATSWLASIYFIDSQTGYVSGANANLLKTTNAGLNWILQSAGTGNYFGCWFKDNNNGVVSHTNLSMKKTTNSGNNWTSVYSSPDVPRGMTFINQTTGFVVGYNGFIIKTTNSGDNWLVVKARQTNTYDLCYINFFNVNIGLATGYDGNRRGVILKTTNGGDNWVLNDSLDLDITAHNIAFNGTYAFVTADSGRIYRSSSPVGIRNINSSVPEKYSLGQNYPNPFNPTTNINFSIPEKSNVKLTVFDITGKEVKVLTNEVLNVGNYTFDFNAGNLSSGTYFYRLTAGEFTATKKMVLVK